MLQLNQILTSINSINKIKYYIKMIKKKTMMKKATQMIY